MNKTTNIMIVGVGGQGTLLASRILGGAVIRSRVRRVIREGYRTANENGTVKKGRLIVIAARSASVNAKSTEVGVELCRAFSELGLYSSNQGQDNV